MIEQYIDHILYVMWLSKLTAITYQYSLIEFNNFLKSLWKTLDNPEWITLVDINKWIIEQKDLNNKTINKRLASIILRDNNSDVLDPSAIKCLKKVDRPIGYFSQQEKKKILKFVNEGYWNCEEIQLRNKLLVYVLMFTWLRIHEALNIKTKDVQESIQIIGKWWKHRWTFFRPEILDIAKEYLNKRKTYSEYLFCTKFRHTFATGLLKLKWSNIYNIARLLGHKNISTTQIYIWYNDTELKNLQFSLKI